MPASPRGGFAPAQALVAGLCQNGLKAVLAVDPGTLRCAQLAIASILTGCASLEIWNGERPYPFVLLAGALVLGLAALRGSHAQPGVASLPSPAGNRADGLQSEIVLQLAAQHVSDRSLIPTGPALSEDVWGDLMARVSHDLRTPLNAVIGFSDVMGSELFGPVGDHRYREYIAHIRDSGRELLKSAEDTLAITALLGGKRAGRGDAAAFETLAAEAVRASGATGVAIQADDDVSVIGDRRALRQVLVNLLSETALRCRDGARGSLTATCEDGMVIVQVCAPLGRPRPTQQEASLHICMARVLLELQGARLIEIERDGEWRAVTVLERASQQDFFVSGSVPMGWRPRERDLRPAS